MEGKSNPSFVEDGSEKPNGLLSSPQNDGKMDAEMQRIPNVVPESDNGDDYDADEGVKKDKDGVFDKYFKDLSEICKKHGKKAVIVTLYLLVSAYGIAATVIWSQEKDEVDWCKGIGLLWLMLGAILLDLLISIGRHFHAFDWMTPVIEKPAEAMWTRIWRIKVFRVAIYFAPLVAVIIYLAVDAGGDTLRWTSFLGLVVLMLLGFIFSRHRGKINWRTVTWGLTLQYGFGLLTIRWDVGRSILQCIGDKVTVFLAYTNSGASMVYGNDLIYHKAVFAFQVLSTIFFFSFCIQILYYYGVMQWIIIKLGVILQKTMGTTACESINTAASVFVGMTESPLLIKPYIRILTKSEIHAIMAGGLATIAGSVMAAYISFGVSPAHLITASVMSAPAALCYSKLFYPETEKTKTGASDITMGKGEESNVLDAAAAGAHAAIELVLGIIANLIAFISFVAFLNGVISWFGSLLGAPHLSFEWILSKVFIPLAWLLGVAPEECDKVATLMGLKTIVNEFVAYEKLAVYIKEGQISKRAEVIATYALCGFSNPGSVGILIGVLSAMAPEKRSVITEVALRSFIAGSATCFLTACVAGTLLDDSILSGLSHTSNFTTTASP
ncbi:solute carrier family 28 member 3-like isoform X2 [Ischnura elegans]|uniref:solute carrier family 28 member 3-like isoform X2 n=1 Tax=Ischnura elegans TaxID=197161 RepID=UPI001ED8B4E3|nr:solute carrier family 28 member 3-like isoform X2 [Ischnura elegans]